MTSTISEPSARSSATDGREQVLGGRRRHGRRRESAGLRTARPAGPDEAGARFAGPGDKLAVPLPDVPLLPRPRVTALLQQAAAHRVTLVCAPGGAGKTVAC